MSRQNGKKVFYPSVVFKKFLMKGFYNNHPKVDPKKYLLDKFNDISQTSCVVPVRNCKDCFIQGRESQYLIFV